MAYAPHSWANGERPTVELFNHIEQGIKEVEDGAGTGLTTLRSDMTAADAALQNSINNASTAARSYTDQKGEWAKPYCVVATGVKSLISQIPLVTVGSSARYRLPFDGVGYNWTDYYGYDSASEGVFVKKSGVYIAIMSGSVQWSFGAPSTYKISRIAVRGDISLGNTIDSVISDGVTQKICIDNVHVSADNTQGFTTYDYTSIFSSIGYAQFEANVPHFPVLNCKAEATAAVGAVGSGWENGSAFFDARLILIRVS